MSQKDFGTCQHLVAENRSAISTSVEGAAQREARTTSFVDVVFDGPPSHESGRFVEVEDDQGRGIGWFGVWVHRPDGYWALRIDRPEADLLTAMKDIIRLELGEAYIGSSPEQADAMRRARAAIAKAEGRS